jgi:hypothetical protein
MEKIIYKFLDDYLGDEVSYEREPINFFKTDSVDTGDRYYTVDTGDRYYTVDTGDRYYIYSKKDRTVILIINHFHNDGDDIKIFGGYYLTGTVSKFFDIGTESAAAIIKNWFMVKHNLKNNSDLLLISKKYLLKKVSDLLFISEEYLGKNNLTFF